KLPLRQRDTSIDSESVVHEVPPQWRNRHHARTDDSRSAAYAIQQVSIEFRNLCRSLVTLTRQRKPDGKKASRPETGRDRSQLSKTLQHESRADQQHQGQSHLDTNHEIAKESPASAGGRRSAALLHTLQHISSAGSQCRDCTHSEAGQNGYCDAECEYCGV